MQRITGNNGTVLNWATIVTQIIFALLFGAVAYWKQDWAIGFISLINLYVIYVIWDFYLADVYHTVEAGNGMMRFKGYTRSFEISASQVAAIKFVGRRGPTDKIVLHFRNVPVVTKAAFLVQDKWFRVFSDDPSLAKFHALFEKEIQEGHAKTQKNRDKIF